MPAEAAKTWYVTDKVLVGLYQDKSTDSGIIKVLPTGTPLEILQRDDKFAEVRAPDGNTGWVEYSYLMENKPAQLVVLELADKQKQTASELDKARVALTTMTEQVKQLKQDMAAADNTKLAALRKENSDLQNRLASLQKTHGDSTASLEALQDKVKSLQKANDALKESLTQAGQTTDTTPDGEAPVDAAQLEKLGAQLEAQRALNEKLQQRIDNVVQLLGGAPATHAAPSDDAEPLTPRAQHSPAALTAGLAWYWYTGAVLLAVLGGFVAGVKWLDKRQLQRHGGFRI
jgi:SH3 domain protein